MPHNPAKKKGKTHILSQKQKENYNNKITQKSKTTKSLPNFLSEHSQQTLPS